LNFQTKNQQAGDAGEFLTLYHLAKNGFKAYHLPSVGYDIVIETEHGLKRVSVKTRNVDIRNCGYGFHSSVEVGRKGSKRGAKKPCKFYCDILACVALDIEKIIFIDAKKIESLDIYLSRKQFVDECEKFTLKEIKWLRAQRAIIQENDPIYQFSLF
jgi:hypothetical protein